MQLKNEEAPAAAINSDEGGYEACTDEPTARKPKRKLKNTWYKQSRFLLRYGPNGSTVFDVFGEPLPRRRA